MASRDDSWVHRFVVSDPLKHSKGFTLYKVTSIVYPKRFPETATKVVVWKRYNDFKKLHTDLKVRHSKLRLGDKFPPFVKAKYFSRFEEEVIEERRRAALLLLEFIAKHPPLYNSDVFVQFFEVGYTVTQEAGTGELHADGDTFKPTNRLLSALDQQCDGGAYSLSSEDDVTSYLTDTDLGVLPNKEIINKNAVDTMYEDDRSNLLNLVDINTSEHHNYDLPPGTQNVCSHQSKPAKQTENGFSKRFWDLTSTKLRINAFTESNEKPGYCIVAEQYVEEAELKEAMKNYRAAFDLYKKAISCWLSGVQSDMNHNRRKTIKEKTSLYLLRAEFIANNYLTDDIPETAESELLPLSHIWRPISQLGTYKVLSIIGKVMLVMDTNTHSLFVIKPLLKSVLPDDHSKKCVLPRGGPYIVNLHAVFETDNAVYLVIQHISTGKLWDYITPYFLRECDTFIPLLSNNNINSKKEIDEISYSHSLVENIKESFTHSTADLTINSSQSSLSSQSDTYLELINDYAGAKLKENNIAEGMEKVDCNVNAENVLAKGDISVKTNQCPTLILDDSYESVVTDNHDNAVVKTKIHFECSVYPNTKENMLEQSLHLLNNDKKNHCEESHLNIYPMCNDNVQIVNDSKNNINENCDFDTTTLVEKAQVLLKSVSETLSKSESIVTTMSTPKLEPSETFDYNNKKSLSPKDNLNKLCMSIDSTPTINDNGFRKSESKLTALEDEDNFGIDTVNMCVSTLDPSKLFPDYIRGSSPVSSGSDIGEVQWCEWGIEGRGLNMDIVIKWSSQLLVAINYLHLLGIIFRDLNPDNILVSGDGNLRLTYQCQFPGVEPVLDNRAVKTLHIAPECFSVHGISKAVDWWSYGVIMYNLITGRSLSYYHPGGIFEHSIIYIPDSVPEQAKSLLEQLLKFDSNERLGSGGLGVEEIKSHPFFKDVNWEQVYKDGLPR